MKLLHHYHSSSQSLVNSDNQFLPVKYASDCSIYLTDKIFSITLPDNSTLKASILSIEFNEDENHYTIDLEDKGYL